MTSRTMNLMTGRNGFAAGPDMTRWLDRALDIPAWSQNDVHETEEQATITIDLPGVKPEQVSVTAEDRMLLLKAEREGRSAIVRQFTIGPKYDLSQVQAHLALGVLTLTLPKAADAKPRQVAITAG